MPWLCAMEGEDKKPQVPEILKWGSRGVRAKIWGFLLWNEPNWFTAKEISQYLDMPLTTVQGALKDLILAPRIKCNDKERAGKGRPEKEYRFQRILARASKR